MSIWDFFQYEKTGKGNVEDLFLPAWLVKIFFELPKDKFPYLSGLSYFEYDVFRCNQLDGLIDELVLLCNKNKHIEGLYYYLQEVITLVEKAKASSNGIIFNPFCEDG